MAGSGHVPCYFGSRMSKKMGTTFGLHPPQPNPHKPGRELCALRESIAM